MPRPLFLSGFETKSWLFRNWDLASDSSVCQSLEGVHCTLGSQDPKISSSLRRLKVMSPGSFKTKWCCHFSVSFHYIPHYEPFHLLLLLSSSWTPKPTGKIIGPVAISGKSIASLSYFKAFFGKWSVGLVLEFLEESWYNNFVYFWLFGSWCRGLGVSNFVQLLDNWAQIIPAWIRSYFVPKKSDFMGGFKDNTQVIITPQLLVIFEQVEELVCVMAQTLADSKCNPCPPKLPEHLPR